MRYLLFLILSWYCYSSKENNKIIGINVRLSITYRTYRYLSAPFHWRWFFFQPQVHYCWSYSLILYHWNLLECSYLMLFPSPIVPCTCSKPLSILSRNRFYFSHLLDHQILFLSRRTVFPGKYRILCEDSPLWTALFFTQNCQVSTAFQVFSSKFLRYSGTTCTWWADSTWPNWLLTLHWTKKYKYRIVHPWRPSQHDHIPNLWKISELLQRCGYLWKAKYLQFGNIDRTEQLYSIFSEYNVKNTSIQLGSGNSLERSLKDWPWLYSMDLWRTL